MTKVIHVHLLHGRKNYYFGSISAIYTVLTEEEVGIKKSSLLHAGLADGGVILNKKVADRVELDEALGVIHAQTMEKAQEAAQLLKNCYTIVDEPVEKSKFIKGIVK